MTNAIGVELPLGTAEGGTGATTTSGALTNLGALPLAGGTMSGALTLAADPVSALQAATKEYVDAIAAGITIKASCVGGTTTALTVVYNNGAAGVGATLTNAGAMAAFGTDGLTANLNDRWLIKNQAAPEQNGIYTVSTVGSGAANYILTRATDYDTAAEIKPGTLVIVTSGTTLATTSWIQTDTVVTVGTDPITFNQFSAGVGASTSLNNLIATTINQSLIPLADNNYDLGSPAVRWVNLYAEALKTGTSNGNILDLLAYDTMAASYTQFINLTAGNPPTCVIASGVTGTTQAASNNSTKLATTAYTDTQVSTIAANKALSNLSGVAINAALVPGADGTLDLGSAADRWRNAIVETVQTGTTAAQTMLMQAYDTNAASYTTFATLTANNPPTMALSGSVTGTTQAANNNSTKLATTAYVDAGVATGANRALSNLTGVAINTALLPGADGTIDLGSAADRFRNALIETVQTGTIATNTTLLQAYNTNTTSYTTFATLTANNPPTMALSGAVTGVTQSASDASTKLATTAYADTQVSTIAANKALSNLAAVAINTALLPGSDNAIALGSAAARFSDAFVTDLKTGTTNAQTLKVSGYNIGGATYTDFMTITTANTATAALDGAVTGVTQSASNNSTKLATTAYVDTQVTTTGANKALSNLAAVAINTALLPGADGTIDLGSAADRFRNAIVTTVQTGTTGAQTTLLQAYDTNGAAYTTFATLTANNPPTMALSSAVTGSTQANTDSSTKLATTAFVKNVLPAKIFGYGLVLL